MGDDSSALQLALPGDVGEIAELNAPEDSPAFSGCTGEHRARIRRLREQILELSLVGVGVKRVARALSVSPQAVRAVRASAWQRGELDPMKQRLGREYLATADLLRAEALERIDEIPAQVLLLASAQAADKGQLLTGGATARIERGVQAPADLHSLIDALPVAAIEVGGPVEPDAEAPNKGDLAPVDVQADGGDVVRGPVADSVSAGLPSLERDCATACVTASPAQEASR